MKNDDLYAMRHSLAHILASALQRIYPEIQFGIGPVIDNGFYYDIDLGQKTISDLDFPKIESAMADIIAEDQEFINYSLPLEDAIEWAKNNNQKYKLELLNDLKKYGTTVYNDINPLKAGKSHIQEVSYYKNGDFIDLCRGPHLSSTGKVGAFKLTKISGAYWRGDSKNKQMQRIYGVAFKTNKELLDYLNKQELSKLNDHRKLGQELDLFVFSNLVGSGLPLFTPRGTIIREELLNYSNQLRLNNGYQKVFIPHITKSELYEVSGHMDKFGDELFLVKSQETNDKLILKPMNCPHHSQIYAAKQRSYKELPIRYLETTTVYRDEKSGELGGLNRVRAITQDDSHIFCTEDQMEEEINRIFEMIKELYDKFDIQLKVRLSLKNNEKKYLGSEDIWVKAQKVLEEIIKINHMEYFVAEGEAAFYGPKIDFIGLDSMDREHQIATIQLDFIQPVRFGLEYDDANGSKKNPIMIHSALLGSVERFMSIYLEHVGGKLPVWISPEQIRFIALNQSLEIQKYLSEIEEKAHKLGLRIKIDNENDSVSKKVRNAELMKIPYIVVIGMNEIKNNIVLPRIRNDLITNLEKNNKPLKIDDFLGIVKEEYSKRLNHSII